MKWLVVVTCFLCMSIAQLSHAAEHTIEKRSVYNETDCDCKYSKLKVHISHARRLPNTDKPRAGWWFHHAYRQKYPDPVVIVTATDCDDLIISKKTTVMKNTQTPLWNEWLEFGVSDWNKLWLKVIDKDGPKDDKREPDNDDDILLKGDVTVCNQHHLFRKKLKGSNGSVLFFSYILTY